MLHNKILIADDEEWYINFVFDRIEKDYGTNMYDYVPNGEDVLYLLKKEKYSLVILDLMMPLGDELSLPESEPDLMYGIYILRKIRESSNLVPVICYTVLNEEDIKNQIAELGAIHIHKLEENSYQKLFSEINKITD